MADEGVYLGSGERGDAWSGAQRSTLVLGPSRSGKTSSLIIPNILRSSRAVVTTSTKPDVIEVTSRARRDIHTMVFDPSGTVDIPPWVHRVGYSPIEHSVRWDDAVVTARSLAASRFFNRSSHDHFVERSSTLVASLLHDAALRHVSLGRFANDIDTRRIEPALELLRTHHGSDHPSVAGLEGVLAASDRELASIWSTASSQLEGVRTEAARHAARLPPLRIDEFLDGGHHLHIVAPSRFQAVTAPLVVGMIHSVLHRTYDRPSSRVLLALDEIANVAPLPDLTTIVSEGGGLGVTTLACLQDLSQARHRWGEVASGFLSLFPTSVILPGITDRDTLELVSLVAGQQQHWQRTTQLDHRGRVRGHSIHQAASSRLTPADIATGPPHSALALTDRNAIHRLQLRPYYLDRSRDRDLS